MKVLQHTRNKRNLFFKPDRAERNYRDRLLKALLQAAKDKIKILNDKVVALETSLQFTRKKNEEIKCEKDQIRHRNCRNPFSLSTVSSPQPPN